MTTGSKAQSHDQDPDTIRGMFASIAGRYDFANHLLSGGMDFHWRNITAKKVATRNPQKALDLACGSGDLSLTLLKQIPSLELTSGDFCQPMLDEAAKKGLKNLVLADGMNLQFADQEFDAITVAFGLRNMQDRSVAIGEMSRVLKPSGALYVLDFSLPNPPFQKPYQFYLHHILPGIAGVVTGEKSAYKYLGASIEAFPRGQSMCDLMCANGFRSASFTPLTGGIVTLYEALK